MTNITSNCGAKPLYLVSACLVGLKTRYDGRIKASEACRRELAGALWIPICPEQLGGLPTPRSPADLTGGDGQDVINGLARVICRRNGKDLTANFINGAEQVLAIARAQPVAMVFLKSGSPSCGVSPNIGVTAALLKKEGFMVREF